MRPESLNILFKDYTSLAGIGDRTAGFLKKLCGPCLIDLLFHIPIGINHRPQITNLSQVKRGEYGTIQLTISEHITPLRKKMPYRILATGNLCACDIELVFFNYHADYLKKQLTIGQTYTVSGKIERIGCTIKILHPDYITPSSTAIPEFEPVYPLTAGLTNKGITKSIQTILAHLPSIPEWLDNSFLQQKKWPSFHEALKNAHAPHTENDLLPQNTNRLRLAYDELLANQLALLLVRSKQKKQQGTIIPTSRTLQSLLKKQLPFELTNAQNRVITEIGSDLADTGKMIRLLQGDVGSGKTIVALMSLLQAIESSFQGVLMAPTDILAHQHFESIKKMLQNIPIRMALLTGREKGKKRQELLSALQSGEIQLLIGTHAVFSEDVCYYKLGLVIIDEQHKFGVHQRLALTQKEKGVNVLVMTATPIPRTLALTNYGDMDISILDEKPANRKKIETRVMPMTKATEIAEKLFYKIQNSTERLQVYWVCPLVEESEKSDLIAAEKRFEELKKIFKNRIGLVHGKMKGSDKDAIMEKFVSGEFDILVATTVIEVGVDVKSASIMVIEQAERFGLAGLHQLRGRVGRGNTQSTCLLLYGKKLSQTAQARLKIMRETDNGFLIAEEDLRLRGAGEILGSKQSGLLNFKFADLSIHGDLLYTATQDAKLILNTDKNLTSSRGEALKHLLYLFKKDKQVNTLNA